MGHLSSENESNRHRHRPKRRWRRIFSWTAVGILVPVVAGVTTAVV
jgi:hypothetical protein